MPAAPVPVGSPDVDSHTTVEPDRPWLTIVWNDPVNLMSYVTHVFRSYFGYSEEKATTLMLQVHHEGRSEIGRASCREREEAGGGRGRGTDKEDTRQDI